MMAMMTNDAVNIDNSFATDTHGQPPAGDSWADYYAEKMRAILGGWPTNKSP